MHRHEEGQVAIRFQLGDFHKIYATAVATRRRRVRAAGWDRRNQRPGTSGDSRSRVSRQLVPRQGYVGAANLDDFSGSAESYAKALAIREKLTAANPDDLKLRTDLADEYFRVATAFENVGNFAADLNILKRAQAFVSDPSNSMEDRQRKFRLAGIYYYTARAQEKTGDFSGALGNYQQAASALAPLAADAPAEPIPRAYLAEHYIGMARCWADSADLMKR